MRQDPLSPSAYEDSFVRDRLPLAAQWPDMHFDLPELDYPERLNCASELLDRAVEKGWGARTAILTDAETVSYSELQRRASRIAHVLTDEMGLKPGNRVLLHGPNSIATVAAWYAILKAGGVVVSTMPLLRAHELGVVADKAQASLALCDGRLAEEVCKTQAGHPVLKRVVAWGEGGELEALAASKPDVFDAVQTAADDAALLAFTSGTTGEPKACVHFHRDVLAMADTFARHILKPQEDDVFAGTPPFAFTFGLGALIVFPHRFGVATAFADKQGMEAFAEMVERHRVTTLFTSPTGYRALMKDWDKRDFSALRAGVSAGEHLPEATWRAWRETAGFALIDGIGSTEMIHIFISACGDEIRPGATGKAVPGYRACILDDEGNPAPQGSQGRLGVQGPTGCRYLDDARQGDYVVNGWNVTGDIFRQDEDGYFWFVSRADDMIVTSGYNIAGPEVEQALLQHDAVQECAVIGAPDEARGAIVKAFIVLKGGAAAGDTLVKELQDFVKRTIAPYKYPREIIFLDDLPKTQTGKIQRFRLREEDF